MGVKRCSRNGCDEVMCDKYSGAYGYICEDCFEELVDHAAFYMHSILLFMSSDKNKFKRNKNADRSYFKMIFSD